MEQPRGEAQGAQGAPQGPQKPLLGSKAFSNATCSAKGHQSEPQELHKQSRDDSSHPIAAFLGGRAADGTASSLDSPGGAIPVSAASHASAAFLVSNGAQPRPLSFASQPLANGQPHDGVPLSSSHGQQYAPAVVAPQKPSVASPSNTQMGVALVSAAQPTTVISMEPYSRPPNPAVDTHNSILAPQIHHPVAKHSTQTASSADALKSLPSLVTTAPAVNGKVGSDSSRQHGSSGDVHGSRTSQSPIGQLSENSEHPPVSKPILKMKRTGQNFPISSPRSSSPLRTPASLHQRKAPSPSSKTNTVSQGGSSLWKASASPQSRVVGLPTAVNGSTTGEKKVLDPTVQLSTNCRTTPLDRQYKNADTRDSK